MSKEITTWDSPRLGRPLTVARWGVTGVPLLLFPTAGGDAEECERFLMLQVLAPFLERGELKVYSVDSVAARSWLDEDNHTQTASRMQERFFQAVLHEVVPAIRTDCRSEDIEVLAAGASIGAYNALLSVCRAPEVFREAICMSGTYDLSRFLEGPEVPELRAVSPLHFLPEIPEDSPRLALLRERFVLLTHGEGRWEDPSQSWRAAEALGGRGIPNRVDPWGQEWDHDWPTWREMLPRYLEEALVRVREEAPRS